MNIEQKLAKLRKQWLEQPHNRKCIELIVEMIKDAPEYIAVDEPFINKVRKALV